MQLTEKQKYEIVILREHGYRINEIAENMSINRKSVMKWIERFSRNGNVNRKEGTGGKIITSTEEDNIIINIVRKNNSLSIKEIKDILQKENINISETTIYRRLIKNDFVYKAPYKKPFLTEDHKKKDYYGLRKIWILIGVK